MSVSKALGAPLVAREWWCAPGEPLWWAVWQEDQAYRVGGLDESGKPTSKQSLGSRFVRGGGQAAAAVGNFAGEALLTLTFGGEGGDDRGGAGGGTSQIRPDMTVFGEGPDSSAVRTIRTDAPAGFSRYRQLWALTPNRLGVLVPRGLKAPKLEAPKPDWRRLVEREPEKFGKNTPGESIGAEEVASWLEFGPSDFVECRPIGSNPCMGCALVLPDGSGFALTVRKSLGAQHMVDAVQEFMAQRSARG